MGGDVSDYLRKRSEMEIKMDGQMILGTGRRAENPYYMERFYVKQNQKQIN